jgi:hypothetical protein
MSSRHTFVAFALIGIASSAMAAQTTVGGVSINLPAPGGFCELKDSDASDKRVITTIGELVGKSGNQLLGISADCQQLADWHAKKRQLLDDMGQYQTIVRLANTPLPAAPEALIKQNCATMRAQGDNIVSNASPDMKSHVEQMFDRIRINETGFIGVLAEDTTACYAALMQKLRTDIGTDKTQAIAFALTLVKGKYVYVYRYAVYSNSDVINDMLVKLKADVAALLAANRI